VKFLRQADIVSSKGISIKVSQTTPSNTGAILTIARNNQILINIKNIQNKTNCVINAPTNEKFQPTKTVNSWISNVGHGPHLNKL